MRRRAYHFFLLCATFVLSEQTRSQQKTDTLVVNFDYNKSDITAAARLVTGNYFSAGKKQSIQSVALSGHCDSIGGKRYNDSLSFARVKAVKEYLLDNGLNSGIITYEHGFGKSSPLNNNRSETKRAANRRVEIIIKRINTETALAQPKPLADTIAQITKSVLLQPQKNSLAEQIKDTATRAGSNIVLENIIFFGGRHFPMQVSAPALYDLLQVMKTNATLQIEIDGYVCCEADGQDGMDFDTKQKNLSVERAKYIYDYLRKNGIDKSRMSYAGFGGSHKRYPEEKDYREQTLNRRVEIKIVSK